MKFVKLSHQYYMWQLKGEIKENKWYLSLRDDDNLSYESLLDLYLLVLLPPMHLSFIYFIFSSINNQITWMI